MPKHIYQLHWTIRCGETEFLKTEWKLFRSDKEATAYGLRVQDELNGNLPPEEKAWDGYYYRFWFADRLEEIDGYHIILAGQSQVNV